MSFDLTLSLNNNSCISSALAKKGHPIHDVISHENSSDFIIKTPQCGVFPSKELIQPLDINRIIQYNYYRSTFYKNQYQSRIKDNGYIKIPYTSKSNTPNLSFLDSGFVTKNIYIVQKIHELQNVNYDAELVIEHKSITNRSAPVYTCFLLKTQEDIQNEIDDLISGKNDTDITLNNFISPDTAIVYENTYMNRSYVILFTTPILVGSVFQHMKLGPLSIAPYAENYSIIRTSPILGNGISMIEGFREGAENQGITTTQQIAGYCTPIDENDPTIGETTEYALPIDSPYVKNQALDSSIKTILNFVGFFMIILFGAFAVPSMHKNLIFDLVMDNDEFKPQRKFDRLRAVEMFTFIMFFAFAMSFINNGILSGNSKSSITGLYIFIFFVEAFIILQYTRISDQDTFLKSFGEPVPIADSSSPDIIGFIKDNIMGLMFKKTMIDDPDNPKKKIARMDFQFTFIGVVGIYCLLYFFILKPRNLDKGGKNLILSIPVYTFFLSMYIMVLFNHYWYVYTKNL